MIRFIVGRLLSAVPLLLGVSFLVFTLLHLAPGNPAEVLAGGRPLSRAGIAAIDYEFHLDSPFLVQYWLWVSHVVRGDLGQTIVFHDTVVNLIRPRILPTVELATYALLIVILAGVGLGVISATRQGTTAGRVSAATMLGLSSISAYVAGVLLITVFAVGLGWFPLLGLGNGGLDRVYHLTLPALALAMSVLALVGRTTQTSLTQVLSEQYIDCARSRGYSQRRILWRHAARNALLPVLTITGLSFGFLIVGAVLVEYTFGLNGLGSLLVQAVQDKDYPTVQGVVLLFAVAFVAINLVVDIVYATVDPRVRLSTRGD